MKKNLLRLALSFCILHSALGISKAQYVTIPDSSFAAWLHTNGWDSCMVGNTLDTLCAVTYEFPSNTLPLSNQGISDLTGLRYIKWKNPPYSGNYRTIDLSHNNFTVFPPELVERIYHLSVNLSYNQIDSFTYTSAYFSMYELDMSHNGMHFFGNTGGNYEINSLNLNYNELDTFPIFNAHPGCHLYVRNNHLTRFPSGRFYTVDCGNNQLSSLTGGYLSYISTLIIDSNLFSGNLNLIGLTGHTTSNVYKVDCSHNAITGISNIMFYNMGYPGYFVGTFLCNDNNLTGSLPRFPDDLQILDCHNNPDLQCLGNLPNTDTFQLDYSNTAIQCLPQLFPGCVYISSPAINALPACNLFTNVYGCNIDSRITGYVYLDSDSNCVDSTDFNLRNIKVSLLYNDTIYQQINTGTDGYYWFDQLIYGTYNVEIDTTGLPFTVLCPDSTDYSIILADTQYLSRDNLHFGLRCKEGFDLAAWSISAMGFRPTRFTTVSVQVGGVSNFYGVNCATGAGISGNITISFSGPATYISPAPGAFIPDNVSGNTLTYNVADFGTVDFNNNFNIRMQTDTTAPIDSTICFTVTVSPVTGDDLPINNVQTNCFTVTNSYDPNDKQVYPLSDVDVNGERWLTYTVNFQNTGTDTAIHIYITDTLDTDLDFSTFQLLAYSHQPLVQLKENAVRFNFPNIMLVDSHANEPLSHGYVQYKIKIKDGKPVGTVINNTAYIYFDFNAPVVTNTTVNTLSVVSSVEEFRISDFGFRIYPNPANNSITISGDESLIGASVSIGDITGREMQKSVFTIRNSQFDIRNFESGVYFVTVTGKEGRSATKKLVIQK